MPSSIDPHIHMVSRATDDSTRMALADCVMVCEPAFWAGYDRSWPEGPATPTASSRGSRASLRRGSSRP